MITVLERIANTYSLLTLILSLNSQCDPVMLSILILSFLFLARKDS